LRETHGLYRGLDDISTNIFLVDFLGGLGHNGGVNKIQNDDNLVIIGVSGYATCGKDTFASISRDILISEGRQAEIFSFAAHLKVLADGLIRPHTGIDCLRPSPADKKRIRPILVGIGEGFRALDENFWVRFVKEKIESRLSEGELTVFIPDCRFINECEWIKSHKRGFIVSLSREGICSPNRQETKNIPEIAQKMSDFSVNWTNITSGEISKSETLREVAKKTLENIFCT